jgi:hypothetical protein
VRTASSGRITSKAGAPRRLDGVRPGNQRRLALHRIEQLRAGDEDDTGAGRRKQPAAEARVLDQIMLAPLDRTDGDGIDHQPRFEARLDHKKPTDLAQHRHSLTTQRQSGGFEPFNP